VAAGIDSTSIFHDLSPGANTAASNTLALIMAAYLIQLSVDNKKLDALHRQIIFAFFQGERRMATLVHVNS
jgi:nicastrin